MTGLYVYCVAPEALEPGEGLSGIDGAPVRAEQVEGFAVWVSELDAPPRPSLERIRRHHDVVAAALAAGATPVPARFGQWLESRDRLRRDVRRRLAELESALARVAGAVEFGVRVMDPGRGAPLHSELDPPAVAPSPPAAASVPEPAQPREPAPAHAAASAATATPGRGAAYLRAAARRQAAGLEERRQADRIVTAFRELLGEGMRADRVEPAPRGGGVASIALLVDRRSAAGLAAVVDEVRRRCPGPRLTVTGPWPPYSFGA